MAKERFVNEKILSQHLPVPFGCKKELLEDPEKFERLLDAIEENLILKKAEEIKAKNIEQAKKIGVVFDYSQMFRIFLVAALPPFIAASLVGDNDYNLLIWLGWWAYLIYGPCPRFLLRFIAGKK